MLRFLSCLLLLWGFGVPVMARQPGAVPPSAFLSGVTHVAQSYNNCGPASLVGVLGYYGIAADQAQVAALLRPQGGYMVAGVIGPFVSRYGLRAQRFRNGRPEHLRALLAAGIPVIVLQWLDRVGGVPHFRVVRGYDDARGRFYLSDPVFGANVVVSYDDFVKLWGVYGQEFIPVFRPGQAAQVGRILGVRLS